MMVLFWREGIKVIGDLNREMDMGYERWRGQ